MPPAEYTIFTVKDFAQIPPDRLPACLADFVLWMKAAREARQIEAAFELQSGFVTMVTNAFHWIDDGKAGISAIEFVAGESGEPLGRIDLMADE